MVPMESIYSEGMPFGGLNQISTTPNMETPVQKMGAWKFVSSIEKLTEFSGEIIL